MTAVTTVALLSKKQGMSAALFSKYWRDVHGMLATRIPGFESYVQFHLQGSCNATSAVDHTPDDELHGIAIVDFTNADKRAGLANSEVAVLIREDEINLFQSSLLYNLPPAADHLLQCNSATAEATEQKHYFLLLQRADGVAPASLIESLQGHATSTLRSHPELTRLRLFDLNGGDAGHWRTPGVNNQPSEHNSFDAMLQITGTGNTLPDLIQQTLAELPPARSRVYPAHSSYTMIENGHPTHLGLRGMDVLQTIEAAGAVNQLDTRLLQSLYGISPRADHGQPPRER